VLQLHTYISDEQKNVKRLDSISYRTILSKLKKSGVGVINGKYVCMKEGKRGKVPRNDMGTWDEPRSGRRNEKSK
jgi:hypothetical protein